MPSGSWHIFKGAGSAYTGNVPNVNFGYGTFIVTKRGGEAFVLAQSPSQELAINGQNGSAWIGWQELALNSAITQLSSKVQNFQSLPETVYYTGVSSSEICNDLNSRFGNFYTVVFFTTDTTDGKPAGFYIATRNFNLSSGVRVIQMPDTWT